MVERMYRPREVAEMLGLTAKRAQEIMRYQMRCIRLNSQDSKRAILAVTLPEIERWQAESMVEPPVVQALHHTPKPQKKISKWLAQTTPDKIPRKRFGA